MVQAVKAAPSSAQANVTPLSPEAKPNVAAVLSVAAAGWSVMTEPGGVVSTAQLWTAGVASRLPAWSVARTRNSCVPVARPE